MPHWNCVRGAKSNAMVRKKKEDPMTMAPGQKKRGFWLEVLFISILAFLLMGARSQRVQREISRLPGGDVQRTLFATPAPLK